jgi:hypothetical protein
MRLLGFSNLLNLSSLSTALGFTQPLTEMSTMNIPGSKEADVFLSISAPLGFP